MSSKKQIRVRGFVTDNDGSSPGIFVITEEGTEAAVTVGANDVLYVDSYQFSSTSGFTSLFFSDDGANDEPLARIAQAVGNDARTFPLPVAGRPGDKLYLGSSGANRVDGTFTGYLYQS